MNCYQHLYCRPHMAVLQPSVSPSDVQQASVHIFEVWYLFAWTYLYECLSVLPYGIITGCDWLCQWAMAIVNPQQNRHPSADQQKNCRRWLRWRPLRLCHGWFWANGWNITKFLFIYTPFMETHLQVRPIDRCSHLMAQSKRTHARLCILDVVDIASHFVGEISWKPHFRGGHELAFLRQWCKILKVSYCRNYCYDSNQILHNDKDNQVVVVDGPNMHPTNPRWWTTAIL